MQLHRHRFFSTFIVTLLYFRKGYYMHIAVLKETSSGEQRVAASADSVKKFLRAGTTITIQNGAGLASGISDSAYEAAGATLAPTAKETLKGADVILCVSMPDAPTRALLPKGSHLVGGLSPYEHLDVLAELARKGIHAYALELLPRISRAQSMDILSSQSNLAGYRAVIEAISIGAKVFPMMMTAAGTVPPAKVLILGAGVAGLQAIATAKRLGAVVSAFDVRPAVKEQVESLGATFIEVPAEEGGESSGGYAKEMSADYQRKQSELIAQTLTTQDIVISTALIPNRPAPELITPAMLSQMKHGAIIVDMAAASGGNCKLTQKDSIITHHGITLVGYTDLASRAAVDASPLFARNLLSFVTTLMMKQGGFAVHADDELIKGTLISNDGAIIHPAIQALIAARATPETSSAEATETKPARKPKKHTPPDEATSDETKGA
jgi:NAD(P) transhydrogenase subunit alpha